MDVIQIRKIPTRLDWMPLLKKLAGAAIVTGPLVFLGIAIILESRYPGYDRIYDTISKLVWSPEGWMQTFGFYIIALVLVLFIAVFQRFKDATRSFRLFRLSLILICFGFIILGIFPTNSPGGPDTFTVYLHRFTAGGICFLFPLACLSLAINIRGKNRWDKEYKVSLLSGIIGSILGIAGLLIILTDIPWKGAIERIILANGLLWLEVTGFRLDTKLFETGETSKLALQQK